MPLSLLILHAARGHIAEDLYKEQAVPVLYPIPPGRMEWVGGWHRLPLFPTPYQKTEGEKRARQVSRLQ